jgi:UDPglucose 6-dehydrogenase
VEKSKETKNRVGIIGLGSVGKAVKHGMCFYYDCVSYDIVGNYKWEDILNTSIVFICVSTPEGEGGRLDCSNIDNVLLRLSESEYKGIVVIKSTIRIGFMEHASRVYPALRLVYMPEFLRENSSFTWFVNPDRLVISGNEADIEETLPYFHWVESAEILKIDHKSAEVGKLAHNAYIATKVSFTNEIEQICHEHGAEQYHVMSVIWADRRVKSNEHLQPNLGPYEGKCVPKDTRELIHSSMNAILLQAVENVNQKLIDERLNLYPKEISLVGLRTKQEG